MNSAVIMCSWLVAGYAPHIDVDIAKKTCELVAVRAVAAQQDPALLVALSYHESRLNPHAVSKSGAQGPLQVTKAQCRRWVKAGSPLRTEGSIYWKDCDLVASGIWTWIRWRSKSPNERTAICRYNAGYKCVKGSKSWRWAGAVASLARKLRKELKK